MMQISFQRGYDQKLTPVYREKPGDPWVPTIQHTIEAPSDTDGGTRGFSKWQALYSARAKVVKTL